MEHQANTLSFQNDAHFIELSNWYKKHPIALYTGAGASHSNEASNKAKYGLGNWEDFLKNMLIMQEGGETQTVMDYRQVVAKNLEPWKLADWIAEEVGEERLKELIVQYVQQPNNFPDRDKKKLNENSISKRKKKQYKQLGARFLSHAPTLNALSAFCNQLAAYVDGAEKNTYRILPNPRVCAVLTSNYDPFLEAASSMMFQKHRLKPVGRFGSSAGDLRQIPVYHIHGYVPYPEKERDLSSSKIPSMVDPVLTSKNYDKAWRKDDVFNFTMGTQIHILRNYRVLFVGFSFRDRWVNDLLTELNKKQVERAQSGKTRAYHYALMEEDEIENKETEFGKDFFTSKGVHPIGLQKYTQIPLLSKTLYTDALKWDYGVDHIPLPIVLKQTKNVGMSIQPIKSVLAANSKMPSLDLKYIDLDQYWEHLYRCRNCHVAD